MKKLFKAFQYMVILIGVLSEVVFAQLSFEPFAAYLNNPVVTSTAGTWDQSAVWWVNVIFVNDTFYLTYNGTDNFPTAPVAVGLAVSLDGFSFIKKDPNPIISPDGSGFDAFSADGGVMLFDNSVWYIYYAGLSTGPSQPANVIGRATSNIGPHGPWTRSDDTLLTVGSNGEWDSEYIIPLCIVENSSELVMYYWAGSFWPGPSKIGMAASTNGGTIWEKYDDPSTTTHPYAESDPVLKPDKPYDYFSIYGCDVIKKDNGWEMFYGGYDDDSASICYAISVDGINWVKDDANNPIFLPSQDPYSTYILSKPAVLFYDDKYFMYYDYGMSPTGIGLATANIVSVSDEETIPTTFYLEQNYPNPFNPVTSIQYTLGSRQFVSLKVYDILGKEIITLVNEELPAGEYKIEFNAGGTGRDLSLTSGVYFYQLKAGDFIEMKKMLLLK